MKKLLVMIAIVAAIGMLVSAIVIAQAKPTFVGAEKGCKTCHLAEYKAWAETPHAKAWDALKPEEQAKPECAGCHQTGAMADGVMVTSVSCEACHGAGSEYKKISIMSKKAYADKAAGRKAAVAAGLVIPTADNCVKCHKAEGNANFKPFDFEKAKGLVHPVKAEAPKG
jgi:mono/diheme cytochrome c family protein